jgi:spore coat polysaccharide biosynthesis protein SpsF
MLIIRQATIKDSRLYFDWVNNTEVRRNSINSDFINIEDHLKWFSGAIKNDRICMYVLEKNSKEIGQVRYYINGSVAEVDYSIAKPFRSKGYGKYLLKESIKILCSEINHIDLVKAIIKTANIPSVKIFKQLNFKCSRVNNEKLVMCYLNVKDLYI